MEKILYDEMVSALDALDKEVDLRNKTIFLFGHCNASMELLGLLEKRGICVVAILDNSKAKQGLLCNGVKVIYPEQIKDYLFECLESDMVVLITSRFYESMCQQLHSIGYKGLIRKIINYNTYAEYSLSEDTIERMEKREHLGDENLKTLFLKYWQAFVVLCPFNALGDIYYMMSYWPAYAKKRGINQVVFCVSGNSLSDVIYMFGTYNVEVYEQKTLDAMIQAAIYKRYDNCFIAHQDRPYVVNLAKALRLKCIPLQKMYCCGVYGLPVNTNSVPPQRNNCIYKDIESIPNKKAVIFSPYAKSVIPIKKNIWNDAVRFYINSGYKCYTNVYGDEIPLKDTEPISPSLLEIQSVVERAGVFIGIRSGLCDVLSGARAKKIALYPDYNYGDTQWKAIDMYRLEQFEFNLLESEEIDWGML